jgi:hypothetical protein
MRTQTRPGFCSGIVCAGVSHVMLPLGSHWLDEDVVVSKKVWVLAPESSTEDRPSNS